MTHPALVSGLVTADGRSLTYVDNSHLLRWPGALVFGAAGGVASDEQDVFEDPKDVKDWGRSRYTRAQLHPAPYLNVADLMAIDGDAPEESPEALRERLIPAHRPKPEVPGPSLPQFARGNAGAAFEARRNRDAWLAQGRDILNPVVRELGLKSVFGDFPVGAAPCEFYEGAQWALDAISRDFFNQPIVPPLLLRVVGPRAAGLALAAFIDQRHAPEVVDGFKASLWRSVCQRVDDKIAQVEHELHTWARQGQLPVSKPEGGTDSVLSLCNAATATIAIYHLATLGKALADFKESGETAIAGVVDGLSSSD